MQTQTAAGLPHQRALQLVATLGANDRAGDGAIQPGLAHRLELVGALVDHQQAAHDALLVRQAGGGHWIAGHDDAPPRLPLRAEAHVARRLERKIAGNRSSGLQLTDNGHAALVDGDVHRSEPCKGSAIGR